jgi:hypothetical protein
MLLDVVIGKVLEQGLRPFGTLKGERIATLSDRSAYLESCFPGVC